MLVGGLSSSYLRLATPSITPVCKKDINLLDFEACHGIRWSLNKDQSCIKELGEITSWSMER